MMKNILLVDDSALMRKVLTDIINGDNRFKVTNMAANGFDGLNILKEKGKDIDLVLLDINMPRMNGFEMLEEMNKLILKAKVIIVSTLATADAKETIKALELGAFDFVTKPETYLGVKEKFAARLIDCLVRAVNPAASPATVPIFNPTAEKVKRPEKNPEKSPDKNSEKNSVKSRIAEINEMIAQIPRASRKAKAVKETAVDCGKLIAIACSTGGPKALHTVIPKLPKNIDAPVLIVQHMPEGFTKSLAERLNELSRVKVKEAEDGEPLVKGTVYIAKGGSQMRVKKRTDGQYSISVSEEAARNGLLPCADIMYESLVNTDYEITCVVLTGMGSDGTAGISQLYKNNTIYVIAQNEETSIVYGMPKVVKDAGLVNEVVALDDISDAIIRNVGVQ